MTSAFAALTFDKAKGKTNVTYPVIFAPLENAGPAVAGKLTADAVKTSVRKTMGKVRGCYDAALGRDPKLEGNVTATFTVGAQGSVDAVSTSGSITDAAMTSCIADALRGASFPASDGASSVSFPFRFSADSSVEVAKGGGVTPAEVRRVVRGSFDKSRSCFESARKTDPNIAGIVKMKFSIDPKGAVTNVSVAPDSTLKKTPAWASASRTFSKASRSIRRSRRPT